MTRPLRLAIVAFCATFWTLVLTGHWLAALYVWAGVAGGVYLLTLIGAITPCPNMRRARP